MISVPNASLSWQMSSTRFAALDLIATFCFISVKDYYFGRYVLTWTDLQRSPPIFYFIYFYKGYDLFYIILCYYFFIQIGNLINKIYRIKRSLGKLRKNS